MEKARIIIVRKLKNVDVAGAIDGIYRALRGSREKGIEVIEVEQDWFKLHADQGWNLEAVVKGIHTVIERLTSVEGYRVNELFKDLQGVTTGSNELLVFDNNKWLELERKYGLSKSGLVYDCIAGEDIKPWSVTIRRKMLLPYREGKDPKSDESIWIPAFKIEKGDALDFESKIAPDEEIGEDVVVRLNKRIARGIIQPELAGVARYLVDNYDKLRNRIYEGKRIEEYAGAWYGFHRPRSPLIIKAPNIVSPRIVKEPSFALNESRAVPLDNVIVLIPTENIKYLRKDMEDVLGKEVSLRDVLLFVLSILNSKVSYIILRTKATKVRGGYYTIDERYLSSIIIPKPKALDRETVVKIVELARAIVDQKGPDIWKKISEINEIIINTYSKLLNVDVKDVVERTP